MNASKKFFTNIWIIIKTWALKVWAKLVASAKNRESLFWYFWFLVMVAVLFFSFALFSNGFTIPLSGDYTLQQIPFYINGYDDWWHFLKTGEFVLWDSSTYLGANNIGSNAFYYFCNPFFLPILLFPRALVPQGLAILMILKMAGSALVFRAFLKYMGVSEKTARLFGLAYGFCGWMTYYLWFNHFMEVCLLTPLVFWGIEKLLKEKKPWLLMFGLFLMGITNFFFLVSTCIVAVIYALFRYFQRVGKYSNKDKLSVALIGIGAFATGILMATMVVLPAAMCALSSNRAVGTYLPMLISSVKVFIGAVKAQDWATALKPFSAWTVDKFWLASNFCNYRVSLVDFKDVLKVLGIWETTGGASYDKLYPLISFFFPTVSCRSSTILNTGSYDNTISSLFIFTPMMMFLIPSLINSVRQKKWSHFIALAFFLAAVFTPFFYYLSYGFTSVDYGRWQIFVVFSMLFYIALNYEQRVTMPKWYFDVSIVFCLFMGLFTYYVAKGYEGKYTFGTMAEREYVAVAELVYMIVVYIYLRMEYKSSNITQSLTYMVAVEAIVMGCMTMSMHGLTDYLNSDDGGIALVTDETNIVKDINHDDKEFFRIYNLNAGESSNLGMREGYNGMTAFHSLYNFNLTEFDEWSHMNYNHGGWSMGYHEKRYNLDTFLGVKYYIVRNIYDTYSHAGTDEFGHNIYTYQNVPLGFERVAKYSTDLHTVYVNTNFIEGGFSYDNLIVTNYSEDTERSDFYNNYADEVLKNEQAYLTGAILRNNDAYEVADEATSLSVGQIPALKAKTESTTVTKYTCVIGATFEADDPTNDTGCTAYTVPINNNVTGIVPNLSRIVITPNGKSYFGDLTEGYSYYLRWILDSRATIYLFDQNNDLIVRDAHSFVSTSFKYMRGFYSDVPVSRIVIIPKNVSSRQLYYPNLYTEPYSDFTERINNLKAYPLENMEHTDNTFDFDTNYPSQRFIVMSVPYDSGWHVTVTKENGTTFKPTVFKAQGGFVGFLSGVGECHYDLNYWTPYLTQGLLASMAGMALFGGSWGAVFFIQKKRKEQENLLEKQKPDAA